MANGKSKEAVARTTYQRVAPNKARIVLDQIRGLHVEEARRVLQFSTKGVARDIAKVLESAIANADNVLNASPDSLFVARCWADEGPTLRRWMPRAQGRAYRIRKRTCHITMCVESREG
jgi:large subunit ribosomal protein L22